MLSDERAGGQWWAADGRITIHHSDFIIHHWELHFIVPTKTVFGDVR
jgi:hypothetical protein